MENSNIEWTDHTFNPWIGCAKVSEGCVNCYAEKLNHRYGWAEWGDDGTRKRTSLENWRKPLKWNRDAERAGVRAKVFCASLADVFEDRPELEDWRIDLLALIDKTPNLDWLLLTKRPENVYGMLQEIVAYNISAAELFDYMPNMWIGTSVENQEQVIKRIPELLDIPASKHFLSIEPLLGAVDLHFPKRGNPNNDLWVIVGGESGPGARPMNPRWVQSVRDQCNDASVPFFFKQWGAYAPNCLCMTEASCKFVKRPGESRSIMFRCGKKKAGRMLDGRIWNEMP